MKRLLIVAAFLIMLPLIQAHALIIGTTPNYPPMASLADQNNNYFGFEIDIMQAICKRIKTPCTFTSVFVKDVQNTLLAGKIDLAIAALIIPEKPIPGFLFSLPYLTSNAQFIVSKNSRINSPADIKNKLIGTQEGTLFGALALKLYNGKVNISTYSRFDDLVYALNNRDVDAAFTNAVAVEYWMVNGGGNYRLIGSRIPIGNGYGIMANVGREGLIEQINQAIQNMMADGGYLTIYSRYFG